MKRNFLPFLCAALLFPVLAGAADDFQAVRTFEFKGLDGPVRLRNDGVVFSHLDASGDAHNAVLLDPAQGSARKLIEGVPGARFVAEDARYLVYGSRGGSGYLLTVRDRQSGESAASVELRRGVQWGHIDGDRLIVAQAGAPNNPTISMLVYGLPGLELEKSAEIAGGNDLALWGNKIVSVSFSLGIYQPDLRKIAVVDMPSREAGGRGACSGGELRIAGDKAVVATDCDRLVVLDLPAARIERVIPVSPAAGGFDVAEGVIFVALPQAREVLALELDSGDELARLPVDADFVTLRGNRLLGVKKGGKFPDPARFTVYEVKLDAIKSETSRMARVKDGCGAARRALGRDGDPHAAIEACEKSGIRGFVDSPRDAPELAPVFADYAVWLARTFSRYNEGRALLERLDPADTRLAAELAAVRRKADALNPPAAGEEPARGAEPAGITSVPVNLGGFSDPIAIEGDRIYIGRWLCHGAREKHRGVVLEVLDRGTLRTAREIQIAPCNFAHQDAVSTIIPVPGHVVLGLRYQIPKQGRPNVVVLDAASFEVKARGYIGLDASYLRLWQGKLLMCSSPPGQPKHRLDPRTASLTAATPAEAKACEKGSAAFVSAMTDSSVMPVMETARFRMFRQPGGLEFSYRITPLKNAEKTLGEIKPRQYFELLPAAARDALVLSHPNGQYRRFLLYDIAARRETVLLELDPAGRRITSALWRDFLFVALGRDLLVYDLKNRRTAKYEKDWIGEGARDGRDGVKRFFVDKDRLIASLLDDENSRVIDLQVYLAGLPARDFFAP